MSFAQGGRFLRHPPPDKTKLFYVGLVADFEGFTTDRPWLVKNSFRFERKKWPGKDGFESISRQFGKEGGRTINGGRSKPFAAVVGLFKPETDLFS